MDNDITESVEYLILTLHIDEKTKKDIMDTYKSYVETINNFYNKIYNKNQIVAENYLNDSINIFKDKLKTFLCAPSNSLEYIKYISDNLDLFDETKLVTLSNKEKERLVQIYEKIKAGTYIRDFYVEILTHSSRNIKNVSLEIYELASLMNYNDEVDDKINGDYSKTIINK